MSSVLRNGVRPAPLTATHLPFSFSLSLSVSPLAPEQGSHPAFVVSVDSAGLAESQGVVAMDHILEINGMNAMRLSHKQTVEQIRKGGSRLVLKLLSLAPY